MWDINNLDPKDSNYRPLHRARTFRSNDRKLLKYISNSNWYTNEILGDKYRHRWKRWIKRRGPKLGGNKIKTKLKAPEITTVMFVPKTQGGKLLNDLQVVEDSLGQPWRTKLVEKPGSPLYLRFSKSFHMASGCQRGENCQMCENSGSKCTRKGVVYKASCQDCCEEKNSKNGHVGTGVYIGETSRQVGRRIQEHFNNLSSMKRSSFIVQHWMECHSLQTSAPRFKFEIVSAHSDALSRQLSEALLIRTQGNLNRKSEFAYNEIIRMQTAKYSWEQCRINNADSNEQ